MSDTAPPPKKSREKERRLKICKPNRIWHAHKKNNKMKTTYIQNKIINLPITSGTKIYSFLFKADDCYQYLSGVGAFVANTMPQCDAIEIELRDDFRTILSFSPYENWIKNTHSEGFNLTDCFKPLCYDAKGRNFYFNVKVTNLTAAFDFVALLKQTTEAIEVIRYDQQSFDIHTPLLGQTVEVTLPSDYTRCKGIMLSGGDVTNENYIGFDISDAAGQIVDPLPVSMLKATVNTQYDNGFYPVDFQSKSRQIKVRLTQLGTLPATYTATTYTVTFLLIDESNDN